MEIFQDASQLEESYIAQTDWTEWPLISSEGDTAAILQHFSDHNVEIRVNMDHARVARESVEGNSRKAGEYLSCHATSNKFLPERFR